MPAYERGVHLWEMSISGGSTVCSLCCQAEVRYCLLPQIKTLVNSVLSLMFSIYLLKGTVNYNQYSISIE